MPYTHTGDLPEPVKNVLPQHAQEIYLAAFNHAWEEYKHPQQRVTQESQEEIAHKVAWAAVKNKYVKKDNIWQKIET